ncbi:MAG: hypothetical protein HY210_06690 [Candidatus Omnitrophica bacterium]|nr:hypothetical protein [Candidatus Omnitrophota bacterium]
MSSKFTKTIFAIICVAAFSPVSMSGADEETPAPQEPWQTRYQWQLEDYAQIRDQFPNGIQQTLGSKPVPATNEGRYRWQLEQYEELNKEFVEELAKDIEPNPVPPTEDELYKWQLQDYPELEKTFHNELMHNLEYKNRPFTP